MKTLIIGLGLIGGSLAIAIREKGIAGHITGVDKSDKNAECALRLGLIDEILSLEESVPEADLIIIAVPVDQSKLLLPAVLDRIKATAVVIDVGSTKEGICQVADSHKHRINFVATHPIAGTENYGPFAATSSLFDEKVSILCDCEKSEAFAVEKTEKFYSALGMKIIYMQSREHDLHAAYVSHLSHISSFMLGNTVLEIEKSERTIFQLAGSGFASTVRLAKSSPDMWAPVFEENSDNVVNALNAYIEKLKIFKELLEKKEIGEIYRLIKEANEIRRILDGKNLSL